ncbi:hypothetical protein BDA99DRAFT_506678 [Phascolomyces articulosus]|uniref:RecQ-mediated genome instability protein 1 n=1 Tax=Phascolomyces articulosus TaxID=60185 RepID=A0AAD5PF31_9FUNG|nr:hypothetical protein BDA99DRAFT_506678 [Phascolomyces articulosus]
MIGNFGERKKMDHAYTLQQLLKTKHGIQAKSEYIEQWLRERPPRPSDNRDTLQSSIFQHFLIKDLKDTSMPTIPSDFGNDPLTSFPPGPGIVLQMVDTRDISNSTHSLLNNLATVAPVRQVYVRRATTGDIRFPRGTLRWTLTDGYKEIVALEDERIHSLNLTTPFGIKLFIKPCEVRSGILFLKPANVKVLGGQVESLFGGNMLEELERRFKAKLGLLSTGPSSDTQAANQAPHPSASSTNRPASSISPVSTTIQPLSATNNNHDNDNRYNDDDDDEYGFDDFGDDFDDEMVSQMEALERVRSNPTQSSEQQEQLPLPTSPSPQQIEEDRYQREWSYEGPLTQRFLDEKTEDEGSGDDAMSFIFDEPTLVAAEKGPSPMDYESTSPLAQQASQLSLASDDNDDYTHDRDPAEQKITNPTVAQVAKYLHDVNNNQTSDIFLADQITVEGVCKRAVRLVIKKTSFFIIVKMADATEVIEDDFETALYVKLPNSYIEDEWGMTAEEYHNIKEAKGEHYVQENISKPWGKKYRDVQCKVTLDMTVTENDPKLGHTILDPLTYQVFDLKSQQMKIYK